MQKNVNVEGTIPNGCFVSEPEIESSCSIVDSPEEVQHVSCQKIDRIRENIIGFNTLYMSPFNIELQAVYVDHTATNRPYRSVEDMVKYTKKFVANPHT